MPSCSQCGAATHRIHRTFPERFGFLAIYECRGCHDISAIPRRYRYQYGRYCRCPECGNLRVTALKRPDFVDPMVKSSWNVIRRLLGGVLYHCRYCRVQFYDRRSPASDSVPAAPAGEDAALAE
jgi:hypothetical protein